MCVGTLQRFMGFALATLQHQAMNEADINAATNVVSIICNGDSACRFMGAARWGLCTVLCPYALDEAHHHNHHNFHARRN